MVKYTPVQATRKQSAKQLQRLAALKEAVKQHKQRVDEFRAAKHAKKEEEELKAKAAAQAAKYEELKLAARWQEEVRDSNYEFAKFLDNEYPRFGFFTEFNTFLKEVGLDEVIKGGRAKAAASDYNDVFSGFVRYLDKKFNDTGLDMDHELQLFYDSLVFPEEEEEEVVEG